MISGLELCTASESYNQVSCEDKGGHIFLQVIHRGVGKRKPRLLEWKVG